MAKNKKVTTTSVNSRRNDNGMRIIVDEIGIGSKGVKSILANLDKLGGKVIKC